MSNITDPSQNVPSQNVPSQNVPSQNILPLHNMETFPLPRFTNTTFPPDIQETQNIFSMLMGSTTMPQIQNSTMDILDAQWNDFIHFSNDWALPSNNRRIPFALGGSLPISTEYTNDHELSQILQQSLLDSSQHFYNVISKEGEQQIKHELYDPTIHQITSCPITQNTFEGGQSIASLPCGHIFESEAINRWLHNEKANCPVCRYKLKSKEVRKETLGASQMSTDVSQHDALPSAQRRRSRRGGRPSATTLADTTNISDGYQRLINSLNLIYDPYQNIHTDIYPTPPAAPPTTFPPPALPPPSERTPPPITLPPPAPTFPPATAQRRASLSTTSHPFLHQLLAHEIDQAEEEDLQQAIIASLEEMQRETKERLGNETIENGSDDSSDSSDIVMEEAEDAVEDSAQIPADEEKSTN